MQIIFEQNSQLSINILFCDMKTKKYLESNNYHLPKYKYTFNQKLYDLNPSSSLQSKLSYSHAGRSKKNSTTFPEKIKSGANFSLEKINTSLLEDSITKAKTPKILKTKDYFKLPSLRKRQINNPQQKQFVKTPNPYYLAQLVKGYDMKQNSFLIKLAKQHFIQVIQALKIGKSMKQSAPQKEVRLSKKNPNFKTIYLDMDQTLIHCDENSPSYSVKLNFPIQGGGTVAAGIRIRPHCQEFIKQLSTFCQVIIFTASSASYADIVLDYLDPHKKYFAHRLYRQHCTLQKGFFVKDLRVVNRRLQDSLLVDNSAFSFMMQPENGVPILPFYQWAKDKQLVSLLQFIKKAISYNDMREYIKQTFFWHKFLQRNAQEPVKVLLKHFGYQ